MKIFLGILLALIILVILILISFYRTTSFVNELEIEEPVIKDNTGYTTPSRQEVKLNIFTTGVFMKSAYRSIVKTMHLKGDEKVMDFGSGPGVASELIARSLEEEGGRLTCLDISETWMKVARKKLEDFDNIDYLLGDITEMELEENTFDVILIHFVLHDIDKDIRPAVIERLSYILKPEGKIVIREPSSSHHGMAGEEVQELMKANGLLGVVFEPKKYMWVMPVNEGVFQI